jgi:hypothetical protein
MTLPSLLWTVEFAFLGAAIFAAGAVFMKLIGG